MKELFYWDNWDPEYKRLYQILLISISLVLIVYGVIQFLGYDGSINWLVNSNLTTVDVPIAGYQSQSGILDFNTQLFLVNQKFIGGQPVLSTFSTNIYLVLLMVGLITCFTMVTYLGKFWYTVSIGAFMMLLIGLRFELLGVFGIYNQGITIGVFLTYAILSYYYNTINKGVDLLRRLFSFTAITALVAILVFFFAEVSNPFLHITAYSFIPALILSIIFIFLVSHEVVYAILKISTDSSLNSDNTKHFVILTVIYLLNVAMLQMKNSGFIDWDIFYINAFVLLLISTVMGFWGLKSREVLYGNILPFYPYTAYLYCGLVICTFTFIGFHTYQANDVAREVIEEAIVFGHLGYGAMFFVYIIVNFVNYLLKNLPVYRIAYKEDNFPYFTFRLAGTIVVAALYFSSNQVSLAQSIAAFYNGIADLHMQNNQPSKAQTMYHESFRYVNWNHKANYSLGFLRDEADDRIKAFNRASSKNPSEFTFTNLGIEYEKNNQFFDALFTYQDALAKYPESAQLKNNLALLYNKTDVVDSTLYYLTDLSSRGFETDIVLSNLLSVCAEKGLDYKSLVPESSAQENLRFDVKANLIANEVIGLVNTDSAVLSSSNTSLNLITYAHINNLAIRSYTYPNPKVLDMINEYLLDETNIDYEERLLFLKALNLYALGWVGLAMETLDNLTHNGNLTVYYKTLLAIWSLEQGSPRLALDYLDMLPENRTGQSSYYLALTYKSLGRDSLAQAEIENLKNSQDSIYSNISLAFVLGSKLRNSGKVGEQNILMNAKLEHAKGLVNDQKFDLAVAMYADLGYDNPFHENSVVEAVGFFNANEEQSKAYDILLKAIEVNQYSERLIKLYIDQCMDMNFMSYAESALLKLLDVLTKEEFSNYEIQFDNRRRAIQAAGIDWE